MKNQTRTYLEILLNLPLVVVVSKTRARGAGKSALTSRAAIAIALALAIPGIACAAGTGTMFTARLKPGDGNSLTCRITNVDDSPHEVRIFIYGWSYQTNTDGSLIASGPTLNAAPLKTIRLSMVEKDAISLVPTRVQVHDRRQQSQLPRSRLRDGGHERRRHHMRPRGLSCG